MHAENLTIPLSQLENSDEFIGRHIGPDDHAIAGMLASIGTASLRTLISETVPATIRLQRPLDLPAAMPEHAALAALKAVAAKNVVKKSLIGQGYYGTLTPPVILRNLFENPGWYTAYTPYQAEIAQGRLEALLNYQQMVVDLTGMEIANASLLDEATAAAEAMTMARRASKAKGNVFFVDEDCFAQMNRLFRERLYGEGPVAVDNDGRIRMDDWELRQDVQEKVTEIYKKVTNENVWSLVDFDGYQNDFLALHGL
jgi:glycine dehydrogenase